MVELEIEMVFENTSTGGRLQLFLSSRVVTLFEKRLFILSLREARVICNIDPVTIFKRDTSKVVHDARYLNSNTDHSFES